MKLLSINERNGKRKCTVFRSKNAKIKKNAKITKKCKNKEKCTVFNSKMQDQRKMLGIQIKSLIKAHSLSGQYCPSVPDL